MKKGKANKWTKKRGGSWFSLPDLGISSYLGFGTKPETTANVTASGNAEKLAAEKAAAEKAAAEKAAAEKAAEKAAVGTTAVGTNGVNHGGSRRKRKTKKVKK